MPDWIIAILIIGVVMLAGFFGLVVGYWFGRRDRADDAYTRDSGT